MRLKLAVGLVVVLLAGTMTVLDMLERAWGDAARDALVLLMGLLFAFGTTAKRS